MSAQQRPEANRLYDYLQAQITAAGADPASRCRVACTIVKAVILESERERKARVERLLSQVDELAAGCVPHTEPPLAKVFVDLLEAGEQSEEASRAFHDRFGDEIDLEELLEQLVLIGYTGTLSPMPLDERLDRIFAILDHEAQTHRFVERASASALAALTGK